MTEAVMDCSCLRETERALLVRAWRTELFGVTSRVIASKRSRARYLTARAAYDAGYCRTIGNGLTSITECRRAYEWDCDGRDEGVYAP